MAKNLISLAMSLTKNQNIFFHCKLEDLPKSQGLNSSLVQSAEELCSWLSQPTYPSFFPDLQVQYIHTPATNMLRLLFSRVQSSRSKAGRFQVQTFGFGVLGLEIFRSRVCTCQVYNFGGLVLMLSIRGLQTMARGPNVAHEAILAMMKKIILKNNCEMCLQKIC